MSKFFTSEVSDPRFELGGLRYMTIKSNALKRRGDLTIFDPDVKDKAQNIPIVILLHGVYGSHWAWSMKAGVHQSLQRLIEQGSIRPMVLAMPSDGHYADGSGYVPHADADYERWIAEEVRVAIMERLPKVTENSPVFISGLSMGGFGALRLGSKYPHLFRAFSGLSSMTHFSQMKNFVQDFDTLQASALEQDGVLDWMTRNRETLPPFRFDCGMDDPLVGHNRELHQKLLDAQIPHDYEEYSGGHNWAYWELHIQDTLLFFDRYC